MSQESKTFKTSSKLFLLRITNKYPCILSFNRYRCRPKYTPLISSLFGSISPHTPPHKVLSKSVAITFTRDLNFLVVNLINESATDE